jgi:cytochrome c
MIQHRLVLTGAIALNVTLLLIASTIGAHASDARAGQIFAVENCSRCHAIGGAGLSPNRKAPPFRLVARKYKLEDLEEGFAEGIVTGHNTMPEFTLTPRQIDDLLAHMRRLKTR